jgi:hypothetical protein
MKKFTRRAILAGAATAGGAGFWFSTEKGQAPILFSPQKNLVGHPIEPIRSPQEYAINHVREGTLKTSEDETFSVWQSTELKPGKPTLVLFPGSVGHLGDTHMGTDPNAPEKEAYVKIIKEAQKAGMQVFAANLVGFTGSNATPSEQSIYRGAEAAVDYLVSMGLKPKDLQLTGVSMGTMVASHAANHLSQMKAFKDDPEQHINLVLSNGTISTVRAAVDVKNAPETIASFITSKNRFDAAKELQALGGSTSDAAKRIHISFLKGEDDTLTPHSHVALHREAAKGTDFVARLVPGEHFVEPTHIIGAIKDNMRQNTPTAKPRGRAI